MSIYEDVAALQQEMTAAQAAITALQTATAVTALAEGTDLNLLAVGRYYVPNTIVSASLLNKPAGANTATAFIEVIEGGGNGQKMMYYRPCAKEGGSYFQRSYYLESWGDWHDINEFDSGWLDMELSGNVNAFNDEQKPRYRRIGKTVFIVGAVKNITANETVIATLPNNYRPSKRVIFAMPSTATKFSRISINTNGTITYEQNNEGVPTAGNWHSVACCFVTA